MRLELAAGAGDGRRASDGAGLRRRLGAAPGLNLGVTGHGRYRDASGHLADDGDLRVSTHFGLHDEVAHTAPRVEARARRGQLKSPVCGVGRANKVCPRARIGGKSESEVKID